MYNNLANIELVEVYQGEGGIRAFGRFPGWTWGYKFFIRDSGQVEGKTSNGHWLELSEELGLSILEKVKLSLAQRGKHAS